MTPIDSTIQPVIKRKGGTPKGFKKSEETKARMRRANVAHLRRGTTLSEETKARMRQNHRNSVPKGSKRSEDAKQRMREGHATSKLIKTGLAYIEIESVSYLSFQQAAMSLNMTLRNVQKRISSKAGSDKAWKIVKLDASC